MRNALLATVMILAASPALATVQGPPGNSNGPTNIQNNASASANAAANASVRNTTNVRNTNAVTATGGRSSASAGGGSASNSGSVNVDASSRDRAYAIGLGGYAAASGPCVGASTSVQAGAFGIGGGIGHTEIEKECQVREAARLLETMGRRDMAVRLILSLDSVRAALAKDDAPAVAPAVVAAASVAPARPDWCLTASPADGPHVAAQCR